MSAFRVFFGIQRNLMLEIVFVSFDVALLDLGQYHNLSLTALPLPTSFTFHREGSQYFEPQGLCRAVGP
jgi:hypothetical protein